MGWETTRRLKLFPKNRILESIDVESILADINATVASMSDQIVFSTNEQEGCYEISWNSSKLSGNFNINSITTHAWDLMSFEDGPTLVGRINGNEFDHSNYEPALFAFDEIRIIGNFEQLENFYDTYLPTWKTLVDNNQIEIEANKSTIKCNGSYTAGNQFDIGDKKRRKKLKETINRAPNNSTLHYTLNETDQIFEEVIGTMFKLNEFVKRTQENEHVNPFPNLEKIEFYYRNRIVKSLEWFQWENKFINKSGGLWKNKSADYWDNCVNIKYREFLQHNEKSNE